MIKNTLLAFVLISFFAASNSAYAYSYECTVYFYSGTEAYKYSFDLDRYDSKYAERLLKKQLKAEGKDPQSVSCAVY